MASSPADPGPLDLKSFYILAVLAGQPLHGYAIRQDVERRTEGAVRLWPATLYGLLAELAERGLIREARGVDRDDDPRRRSYQLTPAGRRILAAEARRFEQLARLAKSRLAMGDAGS